MAEDVKYYPFYIGGVKQVYPNVHPGTPNEHLSLFSEGRPGGFIVQMRLATIAPP
jgi:hypothetical protein